jgi:hypothetical protein
VCIGGYCCDSRTNMCSFLQSKYFPAVRIVIVTSVWPNSVPSTSPFLHPETNSRQLSVCLNKVFQLHVILHRSSPVSFHRNSAAIFLSVRQEYRFKYSFGGVGEMGRGGFSDRQRGRRCSRSLCTEICYPIALQVIVSKPVVSSLFVFLVR